MAGLYTTLGSSVSAMAAQSIAIDTAGNNLANVNNENYSEETVDLGSLGEVQTASGTESMGLTALSVTQVRDAVLDAQVRSADSQASYYTTQQTAYQQGQAALGQTVGSSSTSTSSATNDSGVGAALDDMFNAFQSYAADPTDTGQQQAVLAAASVLTDRLQSTDANLASVQAGITTTVQNGVTTANTLLTQIAGLNTQIGQIEANAPGSAVTLRDQREADLEQLAGLMPITATEGAHGEDTVTTTAAGGPPVTLVSKGTVTGPLTFDATNSTFSAGATPTTLSFSTGSLQGGVDASNQGIQTLRDNLNALSSELVTSVNAVYNPTGTGNNFFSASGTTAATIAIDPSITSSTLTAGAAGAAAGDNTVALGIANLANQAFSTAGGDAIDGTFDSYYAGAVSGFGQTLATVNSQVTDQTSIQTIVTNQRDAVSGVNLDEEMANLLKYQRAYQASAQVFQTVDSLLDTVVNSLGTITT
jgi:flagellar hook-associated protein 1 FlgK